MFTTKSTAIFYTHLCPFYCIVDNYGKRFNPEIKFLEPKECIHVKIKGD